MALRPHLFLIICGVLAFRPENTEGQSSANTVTDEILALLKADPMFKEQTNPLILDINDSFDSTHIGRGTIPDIGNKLERDGEASISFDQNSRKITLSFGVALRDLYPNFEFSSKVNLLFTSHTISGVAYATIENVITHFEVEIDDFERLHLKDFDVKEVMNLRVNDISDVSSFFAVIIKALANGSSNQSIVNHFRNALQKNGQNYLQQAMRDVSGDKVRALLKSLGYD